MIPLVVLATISGHISAQAGGAAIPNAEVRVWAEGTKGWEISQVTPANGSGDYTFTVGAGDYLIDARGPNGVSVNYGDRWYDVAAPTSSGYVGESADTITVGAASAVTGIDIQLEILGGSDGTVLAPGGAGAPSMWVRMERNADVRIHHTDFTDGTPAGFTSMRGMVPASDYQILVYDPSGVRNTLLVPGPFSIASNTNGSFGNLTMANPPADGYENNNAPNCSAVTISASALHSDPPQPWSSTNARIGPLSANDLDWFCYPADEGDRLLITATTAFTFGGATRRHPWTDPMLSFWRGARVTEIAENDDFNGTLDAHIDTGPLTAGCHCAAVTMFGDADFDGDGQNSTGNYQLQVTMGNRPPVTSIKKGTLEVPAAPATFSIDEGDTLVLDLSYADADHDVPTRSFTHVDNAAAAVAGGTLTLGASSGTYTWTAPADAADGSPYVLQLQASDSEFAMSKTVILVVNSVNVPPEVPVLLAPIDDAVVTSGAPPLMWMASADGDGDAVDYDVEVYEGDPGGAAAQTANGVTATEWTPTTIAENTRVSWRVRAGDPNGGLSPWSGYGTFLIDSANDPPDDPVLLKPAAEDTIAMRRPGLSVLDVEDPEDDDIEYVFEIADDEDFTSVVWTSDPIPDNPVSATTMTTTDLDLAWGHNYWARVMAQDVRGGISEWSDAHHFRLKDNVPPSTPGIDGGCVEETFTEAPPDRFIVTNVEDVEGEEVRFELRVFRFEDDPATDNPVYQTQELMDTTDTVTVIPVDLTDLPNGHYRYLVRATDGSDFSDAVECEFTIDIAEPPGSPDGGCCDAGADPAGPLVLVLLLWFASCVLRSSSSASSRARVRRGRAARR